MKTYVITGATGNTGKPITLGLLELGHKVRIISRSKEKAKELTDQGAELFLGDTNNPDLVKLAFTGADAVYAMIPFDAAAPDYTVSQVEHATTIAGGLKVTGVKHVVLLSSVGAHLTSGAGVVQGLQKAEAIFSAIEGLNALYLRAGYFMENTLMQVGAIKFMGAMASPVNGDLKIPMVATRDIAAAALRHLTGLSFTGKQVDYVLGQRDVSYNEVAAIFGNAIGKPDLKYFTGSHEDGKQAMLHAGMGESVVNKLLEFIKAMNDGLVMGDAKRTPANTTSTSIEDFSQIFKTVYNM
ncbi:MAG: NmrA family NAD(P)-binding protein [Bacteroidota bacterium]